MAVKKRKKNFYKYGQIYLMMLPGIIYLFINNYMPMPGIIAAFKDVNFKKGIYGSEWAGLRNFTYLFQTKEAWIITRNTLAYNMVFLVLNIVVGIIIAIFICDIKNKRAKKIYQSAILFPYLMSMVIVGYIVFAFFSMESGVVNNTFLKGLGMEAVSWYTEPKYWPFILVFVNLWKGVGYGCLIYISTINGIDGALFEAAALDGAGKIKQIINITLPSLAPTVITLALLNIGRIFYCDFGLFYQVTMNSGTLFNVTNVLDTYVYRALLQTGDIGMAAAAGFYQSVVGFLFVLVMNLIVRKFDADSALF